MKLKNFTQTLASKEFEKDTLVQNEVGDNGKIIRLNLMLRFQTIVPKLYNRLHYTPGYSLDYRLKYSLDCSLV